jgi:hypothetical protein
MDLSQDRLLIELEEMFVNLFLCPDSDPRSFQVLLFSHNKVQEYVQEILFHGFLKLGSSYHCGTSAAGKKKFTTSLVI